MTASVHCFRMPTPPFQFRAVIDTRPRSLISLESGSASRLFHLYAYCLLFPFHFHSHSHSHYSYSIIHLPTRHWLALSPVSSLSRNERLALRRVEPALECFRRVLGSGVCEVLGSGEHVFLASDAFPSVLCGCSLTSASLAFCIYVLFFVSRLALSLDQGVRGS